MCYSEFTDINVEAIDNMDADIISLKLYVPIYNLDSLERTISKPWKLSPEFMIFTPQSAIR